MRNSHNNSNCYNNINSNRNYNPGSNNRGQQQWQCQQLQKHIKSEFDTKNLKRKFCKACNCHAHFGLHRVAVNALQKDLSQIEVRFGLRLGLASMSMSTSTSEGGSSWNPLWPLLTANCQFALGHVCCAVCPTAPCWRLSTVYVALLSPLLSATQGQLLQTMAPRLCKC